MPAATCPSCGVAVVPGYMRCPKCHAGLPQRAQTNVEGGTALEPPRRIPLPAVIGAGVVGLAVIVWLGVRGSHDTKPAPKPAPAAQPTAAATPQVTLEPAAPPPTAQPTAPSPDQVAGELQRTLQHQQLWSKVSVIGSRVEVRSSSCGDKAIQAPIAAAATSMKAAGLTSLRCVEESGSVVFTREL
jgi:hypothetical protein